jgi:hypothetical protein
VRSIGLISGCVVVGDQVMGEALFDQVVPGVDYLPGQSICSLVAERGMALDAIDIADHFVDHSEYADDVRNFVGESFFRCREMGLDSRPVALDRQLHAQQRIGFRYEGYAVASPSSCLEKDTFSAKLVAADSAIICSAETPLLSARR